MIKALKVLTCKRGNWREFWTSDFTWNQFWPIYLLEKFINPPKSNFKASYLIANFSPFLISRKICHLWLWRSWLPHSVEKREILSHRKIFREINSLVTFLVKTLLSRNFGQKSVRKFLVFPHCTEFSLTKKIFRQINSLVISSVTSLKTV